MKTLIDRPKPPSIHDPDNYKWYYDYNRYFNAAEKYMDYLESILESTVSLMEKVEG